MSEIFRGARYTLGGLIVLTVWSIGMVEIVQWRMDYKADADDASLVRFGPGPDASDADVRRYHELRDKTKE